MVNRFVPALLIFLTFAGCLQSDDAPDAEIEPEVPEIQASKALRLLCLDGSVSVEMDDCATAFPVPVDLQSEPYVAIDANDPDRRALAFQTRNVDAGGGWPMRIYLSEDAGVGWTSITAPRPDLGLQADPVVKFAADGALLASALSAGPGPGGLRTDVWVARSEDLGQTWDTTVLTDDGDNDRQWMGVGDDGTVVMLWQLPTAGTVIPHVSFSVSTDHGRTWTAEKVLVSSCNTHSEPIVQGDRFSFACSHHGSAECRTPWYEADLEGEVVQLGCARNNACGTNMVAGMGSRLFLTCLGPGTVTTSDDGGRTWTEHGRIVDLAPEATAGDRSTPFWVASDGTAWHLVMANFDIAAEPTKTLYSYSAAHLVLDAGLNVTAWSVLWEEDMGSASQKGEFVGIAATPEGGLLAWVDGDHAVRTTPLGP